MEWYNVGDQVIYIDEDSYMENPIDCPAPGTVGTIVEVDRQDPSMPYKVEWPDGSVSTICQICWVYSHEVDIFSGIDESQDVEDCDLDIMSLLS